jgi:hypothetical protein
MIHILSPAKSLDFESQLITTRSSVPAFRSESSKLIKKLNSLSRKKVRELMSLSENLTNLNVDRYRQWIGKETIDERARQALFAFTGDVYQGLNATTLKAEDLNFAQDHLIILSGLYGALKPLDIIEPYRLEMGTDLKVQRKANLYEFWGDKITELINQQIEQGGHRYLINLASNEYFKVLNKKKLKAEVISPVFKDAKNGDYKMISFFAKKARGMMSRYLIENQIRRLEDLKAFDYGGYCYNNDLSSEAKPVFTREENQI